MFRFEVVCENGVSPGWQVADTPIYNSLHNAPQQCMRLCVWRNNDEVHITCSRIPHRRLTRSAISWQLVKRKRLAAQMVSGSQSPLSDKSRCHSKTVERDYGVQPSSLIRDVRIRTASIFWSGPSYKQTGYSHQYDEAWVSITEHTVKGNDAQTRNKKKPTAAFLTSIHGASNHPAAALPRNFELITVNHSFTNSLAD